MLGEGHRRTQPQGLLGASGPSPSQSYKTSFLSFSSTNGKGGVPGCVPHKVPGYSVIMAIDRTQGL